MNAQDIVKYGHLTLANAIEGLPDTQWETTGVCGVWSVKDIMAHLASYEQMLVDILNSILDPNTNTPTLDLMLANADFNDTAVAQRSHLSASDTLKEYLTLHDQVIDLIAKIPAEKLRQNGILAWYGAGYDLDDFLVYTFYGHKREHSAQIMIYRDRLKNTTT